MGAPRLLLLLVLVTRSDALLELLAFAPLCQGRPECLAIQTVRRNQQASNEGTRRECCGKRRIVPAHRTPPRPHRHETVAAARGLLDGRCGGTGSGSGRACGARGRDGSDRLLYRGRIRRVARGVAHRIRHQRVDEDTAEAHFVRVVLKPVACGEQAVDAAARTEKWGPCAVALGSTRARAHHSRR